MPLPKSGTDIGAWSSNQQSKAYKSASLLTHTLGLWTKSEGICCAGYENSSDRDRPDVLLGLLQTCPRSGLLGSEALIVMLTGLTLGMVELGEAACDWGLGGKYAGAAKWARGGMRRPSDMEIARKGTK